MTENTIPLASLPSPGRRPHVDGMQVGQLVYSSYGRRMRVCETDEWVIVGGKATGPYARLSACDAPDLQVIWPRHWYTAHGETLEMFA